MVLMICKCLNLLKLSTQQNSNYYHLLLLEPPFASISIKIIDTATSKNSIFKSYALNF